MQRAAYVAEFQFGYNNRQNPNIFDGDCGMLTWRTWALWLLAFALLLLVVGTSSSFQECMRSYPYQPSGQGFQEQGSAFLIVLGSVPVCLRDFLGDNIEALATLFIAIFGPFGAPPLNSRLQPS
jgi:hypothetical protein